ncbi:MAG: ATP-binding cassette domain-containing protein, partial [Thermoleophilaceae bacterium]
LAIARAATGTPVALVLDEPTGFLPELERRRVHDVARDIAGAGAGVLLISHNLAEVRDLARRVTVLRDGRCVATVEAAATGVPELAALVTGRAMPGSPPRVREAAAGRGGAISVSGLSGGVLRGVSLDLRRGEVLGLTGLAGSGYDELPYLLFGARRAAAGRLALGAGHDLTSMTPARAIRAGIALVPSSREKDGAAGSLSLGDNVLLPRLDRYAGVLGLRLDRRRFAADAGSLLQAHGVAPSDPRTPFASLSGGNQQRALVAKWLETDPVLLLLDEPLRGVDAGAGGELVGRIRALAGRGAAVVCSSADRDGLDELCDRVLTVSNGRVGCSPSA